MKKLLKTAFLLTIPVMMGYLFMGMAFGVLLSSAGYDFRWAVFMSVTMFAGMLQFIAVDFLKAGTALHEVALIAFLINIRHIFFGLSFLERWPGMGLKKLYLIFGLTDETYSLLCSLKTPEGMSERKLSLAVTLLDHLYWITGCLLGGLFGAVITFNTKGIDFAMTALFVVIFIEQWKLEKCHIPALIGIFSALLCLFLFPKNLFMMFAMLCITGLCLLFRKEIEKRQKSGEPESEATR